MKILHVLDLSIPVANGYASRSKYIIEFQKKIAFSSIVVTSPRQGFSEKIVETFNDIVYYRCNIQNNLINKSINRIPFLREVFIMRCLKNKINDIVRENSIDVIHAHSPILCGIPASQIAAEHNIPFVYEVRALWEDAAVDQDKTKENTLRYKLTRYLETELLKKADKVITICEGLRKDILARGIQEDRVVVIPNGVDTEKFIPIEKDTILYKRLSFTDEIIIGFIGSFYKFEGLEVLLKAVPKILSQCPKVRFLIVGGGKEEKALRELNKTLRLEGKVLFTGKVPHAEIMKYYSIMDVLVYPRLNRRITDLVTPLKPLEAMSMEKTVLASDVGGLKELIKHEETGVLFKAEDDEDLAEKCISLITNENKRNQLGKNGRIDMLKSRNWTDIISNYKWIYGSFKTRSENENN